MDFSHINATVNVLTQSRSCRQIWNFTNNLTTWIKILSTLLDHALAAWLPRTRSNFSKEVHK